MPQPSLYGSIGEPFIELSSVDSTNNYALTQLRAGLAHHGTAFFAHEQLAGKGQRGKSWMAVKNSSLILSVVVKPRPLSIGQQFQLSACTGVAAMELLRKYAGNEVTLKWPNDLYWRDRKAGGILIENIIGTKSADEGHAFIDTPSHGEWQWAIIGIGININQENFAADLKNPVSIKQITGQHLQPVTLARELCQKINFYFNELVLNGFDGIYQQYLAGLYKKNKKVRLKKGSRVFEAVIKKVTPTGQLIVAHGIEESFDFGEIEWVMPA